MVGFYYYSGKTEEEASSGHTKHEHNFEVHRLTMSTENGTKKYLRAGQKPEFCAEHSKEGTVHIDRYTRSAQHPVVEAVRRNRTGFEVNGSRGQHPPQVGNAAPNKAYMRHISMSPRIAINTGASGDQLGTTNLKKSPFLR